MSGREKREIKEKTTQMYAALGFGLVCIVVGLPLWWKTTEVYRVQLPYGEIAELSGTQVEYSVEFTVLVADKNFHRSDVSEFARQLKDSFDALEKDEESYLHVHYHGNVRHAFDDENDLLRAAKSVEDLDHALDEQRVLDGHGRYVLLLLSNDSPLIANSGIVGTRRAAYFKRPAKQADLLNVVHQLVRQVYVDEAAMSRVYSTARGVRHTQTDKETMRSLRSHPGYEVTFTLINPQPDILSITWDIISGIEKYLNPFIETLSEYTELSVKSQYLHYIWLGVRPRYDQANGCYTLTLNDLPHIINPMEAHLHSHVTNNPNLNFVVYVPSQDQHPLHIVHPSGSVSETNALLSPRWGGILVYNMGVPENASLPAVVMPDMQPIMQVFLSQLRMLLGISPKVMEGFSIAQPGNKGITDWELDQYLRGRSLENVATATATLRSLAQLLEEIGNIVINDNIGNEVKEAVAAIRKSQTYLAEGKLKDAYLTSKRAISFSEKAFFDPSLLELLYFPEDQKFAIYIPLFLPISIPVVMSLLQVARWIRGKDKTKTE